MMKVRTQKFLSMLCALALLVGLLPTALAAEPEATLVDIPAEAAAETGTMPVAADNGIMPIASWTESKYETAFDVSPLPSGGFFSGQGVIADLKTAVNIPGVGELTKGYKTQSSNGWVSFTPSSAGTLTLYFIADNVGNTVRVDENGTRREDTLTIVADSESGGGKITMDTVSGINYKLYKGSGEGRLVYAIWRSAHTHQWKAGGDADGWTVTKAADCQTEGVKTRTCTASGCDLGGGTGVETAVIPKTEHAYEDVPMVPATCIKDGHEAGRQCKDCGAIEGGAFTPIKATGQHEIENGKCKNCGMVAHTEHTWNAGEVTQEPTCTEKGVKTYTCTVENCGATKTEDVAATGHQWDEVEAKDPTCTEAGWKAHKVCSVCGATDPADYALPAKGHDFSNGATECRNGCGTQKPADNMVAGGWFETLYAELDDVKDADVTGVSYTGPMSGSLQGDDLEYLVRDAELSSGKTGVRIDIPGLPAGDYTLAVTTKDNITYNSNTVTVMPYDRSGYAHYQYTDGVGAYRDDGILKENAIVLYVTDENKNDVTVESMDGTTVTGIGNILNSTGMDNGTGTNSKGGKPNTNQDILRKLADDDTPLVVRIVGTVKGGGGPEPGNTPIEGLTAYNTSDYGGTKGDNGFMARMSGGKNITIEGVGADAVIYGWGLHFICQTSDYAAGRGRSFEVRNISFQQVPEDGVGMEGQQSGSTLSAPVERGWVHNCSFYVADIPNPAESDKSEGDGSCDFKRGQYFTMSYCYFEGCHKTNLVGSSDTSLQYHITWHHNYWKNCEARGPLGRQANMHIYDCLYDGQTSYAMNTRADCYIFSEYNTFLNCKQPRLVDEGAIKSYNDVLTGCSKDTGATTVTDKNEKVSSNNKYENFDTDPSLSYIPDGDYLLDDVNTARKNIMAYTGPMKAAKDMVSAEDVDTNIIPETQWPTQPITLPLDLPSFPDGYNGQADKLVMSGTVKAQDDNLKLGANQVGRDIIFLVPEGKNVDITISGPSGKNPCDLLDANGNTLLTGSGTVKNLPGGTIYIIQSNVFDAGKQSYKDGYLSSLKVVETSVTPDQVHQHSWDSGKVTVPSTCVKHGTKLYTCSGCGETKTEQLPLEEHVYQNGQCVNCGLLQGTLDNGGSEPAVPVPATGITLDQNSLGLAQGDSARLTATVTPANTTDRVVWTSGNTAVATVAQNGTVTAKAPGNATITATAGDVEATCAVMVTGVTTESHKFTATSYPNQPEDNHPIAGGTKVGVYQGDESFFTVTGEGAVWRTKNKTSNKATASLQVPAAEAGAIEFTVPAGSTARTVTVNFSSTGSDNHSALGIKDAKDNLVNTKAGTRMAVAMGTAATSATFEDLPAGTYKIVAPKDVQPSDVDGVDEFDAANTSDPKDPNKRGARIMSIDVTVVTITEGELVDVESVTLTPTALDLEVGQTDTLAATVLPANASNKTVTWISNNTAVATVSAGTVTARGVGTATITAQAGNDTATCTVTVTAASGEEVTKVTKITVTDAGGDSTGTVDADPDNVVEVPLSASVEPEEADNKTVTWSSDSVAKGVTVSSTGVVTVASDAQSCTATITATAKDGSGVKGAYTLTVTAAPVTTDEPDETTPPTTQPTTPPTAQPSTTPGESTPPTTQPTTPPTAQPGESTPPTAQPSTTPGESTPPTTTPTTQPSTTPTTQPTTQPTTEPTAKPGESTPPTAAPKVTGVTLSGVTELQVKKTGTLRAVVRPTNAKYDHLYWVSSDVKVLTVDQNGKVTGVAQGSAMVYAYVMYTKDNVIEKDTVKGERAITVKTTTTGGGSGGSGGSSGGSGGSSGGSGGSSGGSGSATPSNPPSGSAGKFVDVGTGAWYTSAVNTMVEKGLMNGTDTTHFSPNTTTSRAMVATILFRLNGSKKADKTSVFQDLGSATWYTDAVQWANENGVVTGYSATTFGPNDNVTREQLAVMLYRYAKLTNIKMAAAADMSAYKDAKDVSSFAQEAMAWAVGAGIITGRSGTALAPKGDASRAEVATMLVRFIAQPKQ